MLQKSLLGAALKRGRADPIHDPGLVLIHLDPLDQRSEDLAACRPVRAFQALGYPIRELLEPTDHQPQFRLQALLIGLPLVFLLQPREPLPRRRDPRLELRPLQQTVPIRIDQSGDRLPRLADQLGQLAGLTGRLPLRPLQAPPVLLADALRLGQQRADVVPHRRVQPVGPDRPGPAEPLPAEPPALGTAATVVGVGRPPLGRPRPRLVAMAAVPAAPADNQALEQIRRPPRMGPASLAVLLDLFL